MTKTTINCYTCRKKCMTPWKIKYMQCNDTDVWNPNGCTIGFLIKLQLMFHNSQMFIVLFHKMLCFTVHVIRHYDSVTANSSLFLDTFALFYFHINQCSVKHWMLYPRGILEVLFSTRQQIVGRKCSYSNHSAIHSIQPGTTIPTKF